MTARIRQSCKINDQTSWTSTSVKWLKRINCKCKMLLEKLIRWGEQNMVDSKLSSIRVKLICNRYNLNQSRIISGPIGRTYKIFLRLSMTQQVLTAVPASPLSQCQKRFPTPNFNKRVLHNLFRLLSPILTSYLRLLN